MAITTKHQLLAWDLVEGLGDEKHKGIYFRLAKIYDEAFLREILSHVKNALSQGKIKSQDRGRYFMGILKKESPKLNLYAAKNNIKKRGKKIKSNSKKRILSHEDFNGKQ